MAFQYHSPHLENLAEQLKRGPRRLRLRQLISVEFLLSVTEPGKQYPFDFVQHAMTGYRSTAQSESPLISGDALRTDLTTLAEEISADAEIHVRAWPGVIWSVQQLADRFDVSTKTIFRWRKRGLVGWKLRYDDGRIRVVFPDRCVQRFVCANVDLVNRGSSFSQLSRGERNQIIDRARQLATDGRRTANAVAKTIAEETGRAVETIRLILKAYDEAHPQAGIFNRSHLAVEANDHRLKIWEAHCDGATVEALSRKFELPREQVYQAITGMRARDIAAQPIEFIASDEFLQADAETLILSDPAVDDPFATSSTAAKRIPRDLPPYLQQLFYQPLLTPDGEVALFRKMNYLRFKAERMRQALDPESAGAADLDAIDALLEEAHRVKNQITKANLRLVVSVAKRHATPTQNFFEIVSDGNISLMRAVDRFDYSRGFKFSTYASWAIMKNFARTIPEQRHHLDRYQTGRDEYLEAVPGPTLDEIESDHLLAIRNSLEKMLDTLPEREQSILRQRYGLDNRGESQTLEQIGQQFGVSKERIRQLEARAMQKLRADFADRMQQLLGN